jgi:hypothetical protein
VKKEHPKSIRNGPELQILQCLLDEFVGYPRGDHNKAHEVQDDSAHDSIVARLKSCQGNLYILKLNQSSMKKFEKHFGFDPKYRV